MWEQRWDLDPKKVVRVTDWPAGFAPYLKADQSVVVDDRLRKLTREIVPAPRNPAGDLDEVMDWIDSHLTYDPAQASLTGSSGTPWTSGRAIAATTTACAPPSAGP